MSFTILSPCGILGYGFLMASFQRGLSLHPNAIVVDAGSTDAGPHKLGKGVGIVSTMALKRDLEALVLGGAALDIPVVVGSAGGSGGEKHVQWTLDVLREIFEENALPPRKVAVIHATIDKSVIWSRFEAGRVTPLGHRVPPLTHERLTESSDIVAQMGDEPIREALRQGADIIICGRAYDPAPFAAVAIEGGCDEALSYHLGKILECAALCAEPGTTKDCMLGVIDENGFVVRPLSDDRKCTPTSVAAHTFYEKDHPYLLKGPGILLDLSKCTFEQLPGGAVRVCGSRLSRDGQYRVKLEGARLCAYRSFVLAAIRDPLLIERLRDVEAAVEAQVRAAFDAMAPGQEYSIRFTNYGIDGVLGEAEPLRDELPHETAVLIEALAPKQDIAEAVVGMLRSTFLHYGYAGRKSTAGNLAFPFAPSDVNFGPVYEFSVYHLMDVRDGTELFPIDYFTLGGQTPCN